MTAGYSGTPLPAKLGIAAGRRVLVLDGPAELLADDGALGRAALPDGVVLHRRPGRGAYDLAVAFCPDAAALRRRFGPTCARLTERGALWICWPKRASGVPTDLSDSAVRGYGLSVIEPAGQGGEPRRWVDVKVAAIDATWSGLMFVRRLPVRAAADRR